MHNFVETVLPDGWGPVDLMYLQGTQVWAAKLYVEMPNPNDVSTTGYLQFTVQGATPEEAVARLEQAVIETLAQGGQLEERRHSIGRRNYDGLITQHINRHLMDRRGTS